MNFGDYDKNSSSEFSEAFFDNQSNEYYNVREHQMIDSGIQGLYTSSASAQRLNVCNTGGFYPNQNEGNNFVRDRRIPHSGSWLGSESGSRSRSGSVLEVKVRVKVRIRISARIRVEDGIKSRSER